MSTQGTIKRYVILIEKLSRNHFPTKDRLKEYLHAEGHEISTRTLTRDIESLRYEFGVEVIHCKTKRGYYIDKDKSLNYDAFLRFLEVSVSAKILKRNIGEETKSEKYISIEYQNSFKGIEYLKLIIAAIQDSKIIDLEYQSFESDKSSKRKVEPYMIKEYQSRWYLIGLIDKPKEFRTYGLDRIKGFKSTKQKFKRNPDFNPEKNFENVIGLFGSGEQPEKIVLSFTPEQGKYIKSLPFHHSQKVLVDNNKELRIECLLVVNFELTQKLMGLLGAVTVIEPKRLQKELHNNAKAIVNKYKV